MHYPYTASPATGLMGFEESAPEFALSLRKALQLSVTTPLN